MKIEELLLLSGKQFEEMTYDLLADCDMDNLLWFGRGGGDKGRDIVGETLEKPFPGISFKRKWVVQCKRHKTFPSNGKVFEDFCSARQHQPDFWLLVVSSYPTASQIDHFSSLDKKDGVRAILCGPNDLKRLLQESPTVYDEHIGSLVYEDPNADVAAAAFSDEQFDQPNWQSGEFCWFENTGNLYRSISGKRRLLMTGCDWPRQNDRGDILVVSPAEWEEPEQSLWVVRPQGIPQKIDIAPFDSEHVPQSPYWVGDKHVMVICAYAFGTHMPGGEVVVVDVDSKEYEVFMEFDLEAFPMFLATDEQMNYIIGIYNTTDKGPEYKEKKYYTISEIRSWISKQLT